MNSANLLAARAFLRNGIRVYGYPGMTHVKAALYDGWAFVGSANFDKLSLRINQETNLATSDPRFVEPLRRDLFESDSRVRKNGPRRSRYAGTTTSPSSSPISCKPEKMKTLLINGWMATPMVSRRGVLCSNPGLPGASGIAAEGARTQRTQNRHMNISVSELIVRYLERLGIDHIFGMPGAHVLPIYDCLHDSGVKSVLVKHEQGAAFMAGGYARLSHQPSACIATAGPGATNLITGIANAYAERLPVLAITGETPTYQFGRGGLQESSGEGGAIDQVAPVRQHHPLPQAGRAHRLSRPGAEPGHAGAARPRPRSGAAVYPLQRAEGNGRRGRARPVPPAAQSRCPPRRPPTRSPTSSAAHATPPSSPATAALPPTRAISSPRWPNASTFRSPPASRPRAWWPKARPSLGCLGVTSNGDAYRYLSSTPTCLSSSAPASTSAPATRGTRACSPASASSRSTATPPGSAAFPARARDLRRHPRHPGARAGHARRPGHAAQGAGPSARPPGRGPTG